MTTEPTLPAPTLSPREALEQYLAASQDEEDLQQHIADLQRRVQSLMEARHAAERRLAEALPAHGTPYLFEVLGMAFSVQKTGKTTARVQRLEPAPVLTAMSGGGASSQDAEWQGDPDTIQVDGGPMPF